VSQSVGGRAVPAFLFAYTAAVTFMTGMYQSELSPLDAATWSDGRALSFGAMTMVGIMTVLGLHELGHWLHCRKYGVNASLPYFLPGIGPIPGLDAVIPFFGTFGAFIRMEMEKIGAPELLRIAAWGPIAGFVATVPIAFVGIAWSEVVTVEPDAMLLGDPLLILIPQWIFHGSLEANEAVRLHPLGLVAWVGCLLTALNLLPVGQLDGGHVGYAFFGTRWRRYSRGFWALMLLAGVVASPSWLVLAGLVWALGIDHPEMLEGPTAPPNDAWLGVACIAMFVLTAIPAPIFKPLWTFLE
jgi:membrane-associated protease RseP (regulator of RpoE activity)